MWKNTKTGFRLQIKRTGGNKKWNVIFAGQIWRSMMKYAHTAILPILIMWSIGRICTATSRTIRVRRQKCMRRRERSVKKRRRSQYWLCWDCCFWEALWWTGIAGSESAEKSVDSCRKPGQIYCKWRLEIICRVHRREWTLLFGHQWIWRLPVFPEDGDRL